MNYEKREAKRSYKIAQKHLATENYDPYFGHSLPQSRVEVWLALTLIRLKFTGQSGPNHSLLQRLDSFLKNLSCLLFGRPVDHLPSLCQLAQLSWPAGCRTGTHQTLSIQPKAQVADGRRRKHTKTSTNTSNFLASTFGGIGIPICSPKPCPREL